MLLAYTGTSSSWLMPILGRKIKKTYKLKRFKINIDRIILTLNFKRLSYEVGTRGSN
jgi:hypothetical protein